MKTETGPYLFFTSWMLSCLNLDIKMAVQRPLKEETGETGRLAQW